jgi:RNA polymerase sigma-70 factor (ECF subfamily)
MSGEPAAAASMPGNALAALPDEEVVARIASGEAGLFEVIMHRYNQRLFRVVRSIVRDDNEAEDAVQQVYLSVYSHLGQFAGQAQFSTWLTRIAVNEGLARRRQRVRGLELDFKEETDAAAGGQADRRHAMLESMAHRNPEDEASRREMSRMLDAAIDELPTIYRTVFVMRELEQMSTAETASALEITEEAIKVRLYRAKGLMREAMSTRMQASLAEAYPFLGRRCDRLVSAVMSALASLPPPGT